MNLGNPIAVGNTAEIFQIDNKIIKVFNALLPDGEAIQEASKQQYAHLCGLPVPKILDVTNIDGKQAIVMEYVKGETLGNLFLKNRKQVEYYLDISVNMQQEIHNIFTDNIEPMYDRLYRQISTGKSLNKDQKNRLLHKLESFTFENRLCHGDFHLFNIMMRTNSLVVIDWADSSTGNILADIFRTYLLYSEFSVDLAELYLQLYCSKSGLLRSDIFEWAPVIAGARLSENI